MPQNRVRTRHRAIPTVGYSNQPLRGRAWHGHLDAYVMCARGMRSAARFARASSAGEHRALPALRIMRRAALVFAGEYEVRIPVNAKRGRGASRTPWRCQALRVLAVLADAARHRIHQPADRDRGTWPAQVRRVRRLTHAASCGDDSRSRARRDQVAWSPEARERRGQGDRGRQVPRGRRLIRRLPRQLVEREVVARVAELRLSH